MSEDVCTIELRREASKLLRQIPEAPERLFVRGKRIAFELLEKLPDRGFAVVGTRAPQARSEFQVKQRLAELQHLEFVIISGLARGIDACAHETALSLGLPTVAVLGSGLGVVYPKENKRLKDEIISQNGLLISEYPEDEAAQPFHFIRRNRIIAGLSKATWIVEAGFRSGALNTAKWAREAERFSYATPCYPGDPVLAGNENLLRADHAQALWTVEDLSNVWLELHSAAHRGAPRARAVSRETTALESFRQEVSARTSQNGGATVQDLFDWSVQEGWPPLTFYETLQKSLESGLVTDRNGLLAALP